MSTGMPIPPPRNEAGVNSNKEQTLTEDQQRLISDTLSEYDVNNLNETDAASIVTIFSEAGIQPGFALEKAIADSGFDARKIGELANIDNDGNRPPPPPKQTTEEITSLVDYLTELMEEKLAANNGNSLSEEDKQSILAQVFEKFDIEDGESIINTTA